MSIIKNRRNNHPFICLYQIKVATLRYERIFALRK
nr:MAG TPA: hypothetical protein [Caudoviricetes sp.]